MRICALYMCLRHNSISGVGSILDRGVEESLRTAADVRNGVDIDVDVDTDIDESLMELDPRSRAIVVR